MSVDWYLRSGEQVLHRAWLSAPTIQPGRARLVQKSRKDYTCVLGCQIPKGSHYVGVDLLGGGGCGASYLELALCDQHAESLADGTVAAWVESLDGEDFVAGLDRLSVVQPASRAAMEPKETKELERILDQVFKRRQIPIYMPMALLSALECLSNSAPQTPTVRLQEVLDRFDELARTIDAPNANGMGWEPLYHLSMNGVLRLCRYQDPNSADFSRLPQGKPKSRHQLCAQVDRVDFVDPFASVVLSQASRRALINDIRTRLADDPDPHCQRLAAQVRKVDLQGASGGLGRLEGLAPAPAFPPQLFTPSDADTRVRVLREINTRRGQPGFRDALRQRYGDRCLVTGCTLVDALEAAHIAPYMGEHTNFPENGLLLRADIHTLFDLNLLGIEPEALKIFLHPRAEEAYGDQVAPSLLCGEKPPSRAALMLMWKEFRKEANQ